MEDLGADPVLAQVGRKARGPGSPRPCRGPCPAGGRPAACSRARSRALPGAGRRSTHGRCMPRAVERLVELRPAVAAQRVEDVAGQALGVHAHRDGLLDRGARPVEARAGHADASAPRAPCRRSSSGTGARRTARGRVGSGTSISTGSTRRSLRRRQAIRLSIVQILSPWRAANSSSSGMRAIDPSSIDDLADHAGRPRAGKAREIDDAFGLAAAHEDAAFPRAQREARARAITMSCGPERGRTRRGSCAPGRRR